MRPQLPELSQVAWRLRAMDQRRTYSNRGPMVRELEDRYAQLLGVNSERVIAVANATLGIESLIQTIGVKTWQTAAYTFPATAHAVLSAGRDLRLVDIDPVSLAINPDGVDANCGVIPVAPFGACPELSKWAQHTHVIWDAAASLGNLPDLGDLRESHGIVFSLHATKVLPAGEGGLVIVANDDRAKDIRRWINFGFDGSREVSRPATNAKMSEIHAAYALTSLDMRDLEFSEWTALRAYVHQQSAGTQLNLVDPVGNGINPYLLCRLQSHDHLASVTSSLAAQGIETRRWWSFLPETRCFVLDNLSQEFQGAKSAWEQILGLPFFRGIDASTLDRVIEGVLSVNFDISKGDWSP